MGQHAELWNAAAIGPALPTMTAVRTRNTLTFSTLGYLTDAGPQRDGHAGLDYNATGTISLASGKHVIQTTRFQGSYPVPAQMRATLPSSPARYTLRVSAERNVSYAVLSSRVATTWSFRSASAASRTALPLLAVRYQIPGLNSQNQGLAGKILHIPVRVIRQPRSAAGTITSITLRASFDGGQTWHPVPLTRRGDHWIAAIRNPDTPGFVALMAYGTGQQA